MTGGEVARPRMVHGPLATPVVDPVPLARLAGDALIRMSGHGVMVSAS